MSDKINENELEPIGEEKFEENDNWEFEATAHTLEETVLENDELEIEIPSKKEMETRERPKLEKKPAEKEEKPKKKSSGDTNAVKIFFTAFMVLLFAAILTFFGIRYYTVPNTAEVMNPGNVAMRVDDVDISVGMYNYYYNATINSYVSAAQNGSVELDTTVDYDKQWTTDDDGKKITWAQRFKDETRDQLQQVAAYYKGAVDNGIKLSSEQRDQITNDINSLKQKAKDNDMPADEYASVNYGDYCGVATLKKMEEWSYNAQNYLRYQTTAIQPTDKEIDKYYNEHKDDYLKIDLAYLLVSYDESTKEAKLKEANGYAKQIKSVKDLKKLIPAAFKDIIDTYVQQGYYPSADDAAVDIASSVEISINKSEQSLTQEAINWLYSDSTKVGSCKAFANDENSAIYILYKKSEPSVADDEVYSVRHILIMPDKNDTSLTLEKATKKQREAAKKQANEVYEEFKKGKQDEYSFALLAEKYSADTGSTSAGGSWGGVYTNVQLGQMVKEFEKWSTDKSRKYGDTEIVKTEFGYHIMYFISDDPLYYADSRNGVITEKQKEYVDGFKVKERRYAKKKTATQDKSKEKTEEVTE